MMIATSTSKSTIISQQYGLLMAKQNGREVPSADEWHNLASLAVIRIHELEQELRAATSGNQLSASTSSVLAPFSLIENAIFRSSQPAEPELAKSQAEKSSIKGNPTPPLPPKPKPAPQNGWTFSWRGKHHDPITYEAMANERRQMIEDGTYSNTRERELIQKYIPDNTDRTTLNELGLSSVTPK